IFARARRLKPCPRKATVRSGKQPSAYFAVYINCEDEKQRNLRMELIKVIYWDNQSHFTVLFMIQGCKYDSNNLSIMIDYRTSTISPVNRRFHHQHFLFPVGELHIINYCPLVSNTMKF